MRHIGYIPCGHPLFSNLGTLISLPIGTEKVLPANISLVIFHCEYLYSVWFIQQQSIVPQDGLKVHTQIGLIHNWISQCASLLLYVEVVFHILAAFLSHILPPEVRQKNALPK